MIAALEPGPDPAGSTWRTRRTLPPKGSRKERRSRSHPVFLFKLDMRFDMLVVLMQPGLPQPARTRIMGMRVHRRRRRNEEKHAKQGRETLGAGKLVLVRSLWQQHQRGHLPGAHVPQSALLALPALPALAEFAAGRTRRPPARAIHSRLGTWPTRPRTACAAGTSSSPGSGDGPMPAGPWASKAGRSPGGWCWPAPASPA